MPLPDDREVFNFNDLVKEMEQLGWKKTLEFDWIEFDQRNRRILKLHYVFDANRSPCLNKSCRGSELVYFQLAPSGVIWTCASCRKTMGPIAFEDAANTVSPVEITFNQALEIIKQTKQIMPIGLTPQMGTRKIVR